MSDIMADEIPRHKPRDLLRMCVNERLAMEGGIANFARKIGIAQSTLHTWISANHKISTATRFKIESYFNDNGYEIKPKNMDAPDIITLSRGRFRKNSNCVLASLSWLVGHQISWPQAYEQVWDTIGQQSQRGITIDEIIEQLGYQFSTLAVMPMAWNGLPECKPIPVYTDLEKRLMRYIETRQGLLIGATEKMGHCIAFKMGCIHDPRYGDMFHIPDDFNPKTIHLRITSGDA